LNMEQIGYLSNLRMWQCDSSHEFRLQMKRSNGSYEK
jgi:hypothetical protein